MISSLLLLSFALPQESVPTPVETTIDRVTLYDGQALVERAVLLNPTEPGEMWLSLSPLPLGLDSSSFQTKIEMGEAKVLSVEAHTVTGTALDNTRRDELRAELASLQKENRNLDSTRVAIETEKSMLAAMIQAVANGEKPDGFLVDLGEVGKMASALDRRLAQYEMDADALRLKIKAIESKLGGGGRQLRRYKEGRIRVWIERPGEVLLRASYLIGGASWRPNYTVRVSPDLTGVTVGLVAHLVQKTGEDWENAEILLSTSTPSIGLDPPSLPIRVFRLPLPRLASKSPATPSAKFEAGTAFDEEGVSASLGIGGGAGGKYGSRTGRILAAPEVQVQDLGLTALFQLPERKTLPSDGEPYRFRIREVPLDVRPERYVVPTLSSQAFLRARVQLTGDVPLLPGTAKIFLGPDYLGESQFPVLRPGDFTTIHLGVDPNLSVQWETVLDERDNPGLLSSTATISRVYRAILKLSSNAPGEIEVVMEEAIPLSRTSALSITPSELRPAPIRDEEASRLQKEKGVFRWKVSMAPGQGQNIYWGYDLEFDEDLNPILAEE
ncbi:MAG TPA: DUF4139 domain-containing protein [Planctomycetota bacterium]|jgi:uncharacterized protein (TIGR02231 family)|nr:DUF4139 domain-containing protein [Planctomycetota bacterium]HJM38904.1 DUF4139 domain-containing protein [Planctomycetota bacterium]